MGSHHTRKAFPALDVPAAASFHFLGVAGDRLDANAHNWLLTTPDANPAMLQMFRDRERTPDRNLVPWAGEFAGKYLISAVQAMRIDPVIRDYIQAFVNEMIECQDEDGYFGPFPRQVRIFGPNHNDAIWDLWGHYHCMLGFYLWHVETNDVAAFDCCLKAADYLCSVFLDGSRRVYETLAEEMNQSSIHIFTLLYQATSEQHYLDMARHIEQDWQNPPSGDYLRSALAGKPFYECPKPRWESLPSIQAMGELYYITGDTRYKQAMENLWWSIVESDRHNTGGFSSGEQAQGNPYHEGAIETCCTVAWMALTIDMLRLSGDCQAADELELSTFNATFGAQHPSGRWWTYNTPMDGERRASGQDIVFQARAGSPELNCCSVNAPRSLGMLSEWSVMTSADGIALNYYGPSEFTVTTASGNAVRISQSTDYPIGESTKITLTPDREEKLLIRLRIPSWSRRTRVSVNGERLEGVTPGYLPIERVWKSGDEIEISFDMSIHVWVGERESEGKVSIYRGPLLLAYDPRHDIYDPDSLPELDFDKAPIILEPDVPRPKPQLLLKFHTINGGFITLCDFATAGTAGNRYISWLPGRGSGHGFDRKNPQRRVSP